jgi:hypothetical protein
MAMNTKKDANESCHEISPHTCGAGRKKNIREVLAEEVKHVELLYWKKCKMGQLHSKNCSFLMKLPI